VRVDRCVEMRMEALAKKRRVSITLRSTGSAYSIAALPATSPNSSAIEFPRK